MTPTQVDLVQSTFAKVEPIAMQAADLFYTRLFELDPSLRHLFKSDLTAQKQKLMLMLGTAVKGLNDLDTLVPVARDLGFRHRAYGVQTSHYATVGEALLWTLEKGLGEAFTPDVRAAWTEVYTVLASVMQEGANAVMN